MKKLLTALTLGTAALMIASCGPQASTGDSGGGGAKICPADKMQGLIGKPATEAGRFLAKVPAAERTPTYYVGKQQQLPNTIERGATMVILNTPVVSSNPDLSAYTVADVRCFTGAQWAN